MVNTTRFDVFIVNFAESGTLGPDSVAQAIQEGSGTTVRKEAGNWPYMCCCRCYVTGRTWRG